MCRRARKEKRKARVKEVRRKGGKSLRLLTELSFIRSFSNRDLSIAHSVA